MAKLIELAHRPTPGQRLISWASRPPGRLYLSACAAIALVLLYEDSMPGGHLPSFLLGAVGGSVLAIMGALRLGIAFVIARPMIRRHWLRWAVAPLVASLAILLSLADIPLQGRVLTSEPSLLRLSEELDTSSTVPFADEWVGMYPVAAATATDDGARFAIRGAGLLRPSGLAYSETRLPTDVFVPGHDGRVYEHITGPWYVWTAY